MEVTLESTTEGRNYVLDLPAGPVNAQKVANDLVEEAMEEIDENDAKKYRVRRAASRQLPAKFRDFNVTPRLGPNDDPEYVPQGVALTVSTSTTKQPPGGLQTSSSHAIIMEAAASSVVVNSNEIPVDRIFEVELEEDVMMPSKISFAGMKMNPQPLKKKAKVYMKDLSEVFPCPECGRMFTLKCNMTAHRMTHSNIKPFTCEYPGCYKSFRTKETCRRHYSTHTGEKGYQCGTCTKRFSSNQALKEHLTIHADQKLYQCGVCGREFRQLSSLSRHLITHGGEKKFKCDLCGKRFTQNVYLKSHKRTHTGDKPYKCDICGKCYGYPSDLNRHKIIHTGEKPFACDLCDAAFADPSAKRRHMRDHTEVRTYTCHLCEQVFRRFGLLKAHLSKKHNIVEVSDDTSQDTLQIYANATDNVDEASVPLEQVQSQLQQVLTQLRQARPNTRYQLITPGAERHIGTVDELLRASRQVAGESFTGVTEEEQDLAVQLAMSALNANSENVELVEADSELHISSDGTISEPLYLTELPKSFEASEIVIDGQTYPFIVTNENVRYEVVRDVAEDDVEKGRKGNITADSGANKIVDHVLKVSGAVDNVLVEDPNIQEDDNIVVDDLPEYGYKVIYLKSGEGGSESNVIDGGDTIIENESIVMEGEGTVMESEESVVEVHVDVEEEEVNIEDCDSTLETANHQMHYATNPDFSNQDYYNWLANFCELSKVLPLPLEQGSYEKVTRVHKSLTEALAKPVGNLCERKNFLSLLNTSKSLSGIINEHLASLLTNLK